MGNANSSQVLSDNEELLAEVEELEAKLNGGACQGTVVSDEDEDVGWEESADDVYVLPRGL